MSDLLNVPLIVQSPHVDYHRPRANEWLDAVARKQPTAGGTQTTAEVLGIHDRWPNPGWADERLTRIGQLIERALDEDVIRVSFLAIGERRPSNSIRLVQLRTGNECQGARLLVTTRGGVVLANHRALWGGDLALWAEDFTQGNTGRDAAVAVLGNTAHLIHDMVAHYRDANGN